MAHSRPKDASCAGSAAGKIVKESKRKDAQEELEKVRLEEDLQNVLQLTLGPPAPIGRGHLALAIPRCDAPGNRYCRMIQWCGRVCMHCMRATEIDDCGNSSMPRASAAELIIVIRG